METNISSGHKSLCKATPDQSSKKSKNIFLLCGFGFFHNQGPWNNFYPGGPYRWQKNSKNFLLNKSLAPVHNYLTNWGYYFIDKYIMTCCNQMREDFNIVINMHKDIDTITTNDFPFFVKYCPLWNSKIYGLEIGGSEPRWWWAETEWKKMTAVEAASTRYYQRQKMS